MNYVEKFVKGTTIVFLMHIVGGAIGYLLRLFIARNLTVTEFGLLYAVLSFVGFLTMFRDLGFGPALTKFVAESSAKKDQREIKSTILIVVGFEVLTGAILALAVFIFADFISMNYFKANASLLLKVIVASFAVSGFISIQFVFQGLGKIKHYAVIEPIRNGLTLLAAMMLIGFGIIGIAYGYLLAAAATSIIIFLLMVKVFPFFRVKSKINKPLTKKILLFSLPVFFTSIGGTLLGYMDTVLITYFLSVREVGLYQVALPTSQLLWVLAGSVSVILLPTISYIHAKGDRTALSKIIGLVLKFSFILIIPFVIIVVAFPDVVIRLLFGEAYISAAAALQVLAFTTLFYTLFAAISSAILGIGKPMINMKIITIMGVLNIVLNIILIPTMGIVGSAATILASYFVGALISIVYLRREMNFKFYWQDMVKAFIGGTITLTVFAISKNAFDANPWLKLAVASVTGMFFYAIFIYTTKTVTKDEIRLLGKAGIFIPKFLLRVFDRI